MFHLSPDHTIRLYVFWLIVDLFLMYWREENVWFISINNQIEWLFSKCRLRSRIDTRQSALDYSLVAHSMLAGVAGAVAVTARRLVAMVGSQFHGASRGSKSEGKLSSVPLNTGRWTISPISLFLVISTFPSHTYSLNPLDSPPVIRVRFIPPSSRDCSRVHAELNK